MAVVIAVPAETLAGERRFALTPDVVKRLRQSKAEVRLQTGGASKAHFRDSDFADTQFAASVAELYSGANVVLKVQPPSLEEAAQLPQGSILISFLAPGRQPELAKLLRDRNITSLQVSAAKIDANVLKLEHIAARGPDAAHALASSASTQFFVASLVMLIAFGGVLIGEMLFKRLRFFW